MKAAPTAKDTLFPYLFGGTDLAGKKIVDLFAGGGGVSSGIEQALGRSPDVAINHDEEAIAMHQINHPLTRHYRTDIFEVDPFEAVGDAPVALLWLSPDCTHHSVAKGGKPLDNKSRSLAWVGKKWAGKKRPDVIVLENVPAFEHWGRLVAQRGEVGTDGKIIKSLWPNKPKRRGKACRRWQKGMTKQKPPRGPVRYDDQGQQLKVADKRPRYRGRTFRRFVKDLRDMGYVVDHRTLVAADYGVPTIRKRFFLIARCDGKPIVWPEQTHATPDDPRVLNGTLKPWRTAAECIDWSLPIPSVFPEKGGRERPLADKSLRRVALGVHRFVLQAQQPFLVNLSHGGHDSRQKSVEEPLWTITGSGNGVSVVMPHIVPMNAENPTQSVKLPLGVITTGNRFYVGAPYIVPRYSERERQLPRTQSVEAPASTITATANGQRLVAAFITEYHAPKSASEVRGTDVRLPVKTVDTSNRFWLAGVAIHQHNDGGLAPEHACYPVNRPVRSVVASGGRQGPVAAFIVQYNSTTFAQSADEPNRTITATERFGPSVVHLYRDFGSSVGRRVDAPLASQTTVVKDGLLVTRMDGGLDAKKRQKAHLVYALMEKHCPQAIEQLAPEDREERLINFYLNGVKCTVWDIGLRMFIPRELYKCQGFHSGYIIEFAFKGKKLAKDSQTRMCGNSVPPPLVSAIVGAQFERKWQEAAD